MSAVKDIDAPDVGRPGGARTSVRGTDRPVPLTRHRAVTRTPAGVAHLPSEPLSGEPLSGRPLSVDAADAAIDALVARLLRDTAPGEHPGTAGALGVLVQAHDALSDPRLPERIGELADRLDRAVDRRPEHRPVGLYFGVAGPVWALADAARSLGDPGLLRRSVDRALVLSADRPGPDVTHGTAGLGLTLTHLWELTGDVRLATRVADIGHDLLDPAEVHGTAGVGYFLDGAARVTGSARLRSAAARAARSLASTAVVTDGRASWTTGSAGVATFLLYHALGGGDVDPRLLHAAARGIVADRCRPATTYCHGLSGGADVLLDYPAVWCGPTGGLDPAAVTGPYRAWAGDLLRLAWEWLAGEPGRIAPDFNAGYGGTLSALLRWRYGGRRLWLPSPAAAVSGGAR